MKVKVINIVKDDREYNSLEEAKEDLIDEYMSCCDSRKLLNSWIRLSEIVDDLVAGREDINKYLRKDGSILIRDRYGIR